LGETQIGGKTKRREYEIQFNKKKKKGLIAGHNEKGNMLTCTRENALTKGEKKVMLRLIKGGTLLLILRKGTRVISSNRPKGKLRRQKS